MDPKISVIVPVYNVEKYLHRCIDSILTQTFTDFEVLLINDGSKDRSGEICDEYAKKDSRVKVFHKENGGVSSARNVGLDNARGDLICFCDSDDFVTKDWLALFVKNIDGYDAVITGFFFVKNNFKKPFSVSCDSSSPSQIADLLNSHENFGYLWCKCFKRLIINDYKLRFNKSFTLMEDEDFVCRYFSLVSDIKVVDKQTYYYFEPDADTKYAGIDCFDVYLSMLKVSLHMISYRHSPSLDRYASCCHRYLLRAFRDGHYLIGWRRLKGVAGIKNKKNLISRMRFINASTFILWYVFFIVYGKLKNKNK